MIINEKKVIFIRIGWMEYYGFIYIDERPIGGGSFNIDNIGSEANNFKDYEGKLYGYVQINSKNYGINLKRVDPENYSYEDSIDNVLVIAVSTNPEEGKQRIVGWYKNATVFNRAEEREDGDGLYNFTADTEDSCLLPVNKRNFIIPKGEGGMGQSPIYYIYDAEGNSKYENWINSAINLSETYKGVNLLESKAYSEEGENENEDIDYKSIDESLEDVKNKIDEYLKKEHTYKMEYAGEKN